MAKAPKPPIEQHFVLTGKTQQQLGIEGFRKPRVGNRRRQPVRRQLVCRLEALAEPRAE
jgi:hypothetical protein